jgi:PAS domain S-box-containing protein
VTRSTESSDAVAQSDNVLAPTERETPAALIAALRDSVQRYNVIFEHSLVGVAVVSLKAGRRGRLLQVNAAMCDLTGRTEAQLLQLGWSDLAHPHDVAEHGAVLDALARREIDATDHEGRWIDTSGATRWVSLRLHSLGDGRSPPMSAVGQVEDVTVSHHSEVALRARQERFRRAYDNAVTGVMFLGLDGRVREANTAFSQFLDRTEEELVGQHLGSLVAADEVPGLRRPIAELAAGIVSTYQAEHRFNCGDGAHAWGMVSGTLADDAAGEPSYLVFQVRDITRPKDAEFRLSHQALHDGLTGLPNRLLLHDRIEQARGRAERNGTRLAVLFVDLDDFKRINDDLGDAAGDHVLIESPSGCSRSCVRRTPRAGGAETSSSLCATTWWTTGTSRRS